MHVANGLKKGNIILFLWRFTTVSKQKQWFAVTLFMRFFQPLNASLSWPRCWSSQNGKGSLYLV
jgi:hypothetical protein